MQKPPGYRSGLKGGFGLPSASRRWASLHAQFAFPCHQLARLGLLLRYANTIRAIFPTFWCLWPEPERADEFDEAWISR